MSIQPTSTGVFTPEELAKMYFEMKDIVKDHGVVKGFNFEESEKEKERLKEKMKNIEEAVGQEMLFIYGIRYDLDGEMVRSEKIIQALETLGERIVKMESAIAVIGNAVEKKVKDLDNVGHVNGTNLRNRNKIDYESYY